MGEQRRPYFFGAGYAVVSSSLPQGRGRWRNHCSFYPRPLETRAPHRAPSRASSLQRRAALCGCRPFLPSGFAFWAPSDLLRSTPCNRLGSSRLRLIWRVRPSRSIRPCFTSGRPSDLGSADCSSRKNIFILSAMSVWLLSRLRACCLPPRGSERNDVNHSVRHVWANQDLPCQDLHTREIRLPGLKPEGRPHGPHPLHSARSSSTPNCSTHPRPRPSSPRSPRPRS